MPVASRVGKKLGLQARTQLSPVLERCCLVASAKASYQEAEEELQLMMGLTVGRSTLHRLVERCDLPEAPSDKPVAGLSVDGGKVRLRTPTPGACEWRDYKAVQLHDSVCGAYFQDNDALVAWVKRHPLRSMVTCVGDGHDGVWNIIARLVPDCQRREVLDWYHLVENLYKLGGSRRRLERLKASLRSGCLDEVFEVLERRRGYKSQRLRAYLEKHRQRLVNYDLYQALGVAIGSGAVESAVKRIGARLKLSGAQWLKRAVPKMLRLRCAYLNGAFSLRVSA